LPVWFKLNGITAMAKANAALPRFIREFNQRFHRKAACQDDTAFAPLPADFSLDTLLAAKYNRKTDNRGCFSFQNYTFQVDSPKPPVKKNIVFLFSEKIGFKVYYDKTCCEVKFPAFLNKDKKSHLPQVTKRLIHDSFFASVKVPELAGGRVNESLVIDTFTFPIAMPRSARIWSLVLPLMGWLIKIFFIPFSPLSSFFSSPVLPVQSRTSCGACSYKRVD
jgi:hypothetical protein